MRQLSHLLNREYCEGLSDQAARALTDIWVNMHHVEVHGRTCVPFTSDFFIQEARDFILRAQTQSGRRRCLKIIGDATHDQSSQGLRKFQVGFAGCNFEDGQWRNTILPVVFGIIDEETIVNVRACIQMVVDAFRAHGIEIEQLGRIGIGMATLPACM